MSDEHKAWRCHVCFAGRGPFFQIRMYPFWDCAPCRILRIPGALPRLSNGTLSNSLRNSAEAENASPLQYSGEHLRLTRKSWVEFLAASCHSLRGSLSMGFAFSLPFHSKIMVRQTGTGESRAVGEVPTSLLIQSNHRAGARCPASRMQYTSGWAQWLTRWAHSPKVRDRSHAPLFDLISQDRHTKQDG